MQRVSLRCGYAITGGRAAAYRRRRGCAQWQRCTGACAVRRPARAVAAVSVLQLPAVATPPAALWSGPILSYPILSTSGANAAAYSSLRLPTKACGNKRSRSSSAALQYVAIQTKMFQHRYARGGADAGAVLVFRRSLSGPAKLNASVGLAGSWSRMPMIVPDQPTVADRFG